MRGSDRYDRWWEEEDESEDESEDQPPAVGDYLKGGDKVKWTRPAPTPIVDDFIFQHTETTYAIVEGNIPVIRIFGCTKEGCAVLFQTSSFKPYFYAQIDNAYDAETVHTRLEALLKDECKGKNSAKQYVLKMERVEKRSIIGYHCNRPLTIMYKITMAHPSHVAKARQLLEMGNRALFQDKSINTFEANVPFELRYMIDMKFSGCQWVKLKAGTYQFEGTENNRYNVIGSSIEPISLSDIAPIRVLSFDIEAKRKGNGFVKSDVDPCVCICTALEVVGQGVVHTCVFGLDFEGGGCDKVEGANDMFIFQKEEDMLLAFAQYVQECDPEAFTGWNITGFDWPYLAGRAKQLGIMGEFMNITRTPGKTAWIRSRTYQSKAHGAKIQNELMCEGRFDYDAMLYMIKCEYKKRRSYKLNAVAKEEVGDQKVDVHHTQIPILHEKSPAGRARLFFYCLKDALLPTAILRKRQAFVSGIEQSRVTGVPIKWLISRGQGIKTFSKILRSKPSFETTPSRSPKLNNVFTAGGYVQDPIVGIYTHPLFTLDFASLYPSIMQAYNICYSTVLPLSVAQKMFSPDDYHVPPTYDETQPVDYCFVKEHIRKGILPDMLTDLLGQRAYVKGLMKKLDKIVDEFLLGVYDSRQNAIKVCCNSVYGFLKAFILIDPRLMAAVTAWGRWLAQTTAKMIVDKYKGSRNIYSDTDSVKIDFGPVLLQDGMRLAREAAKMCTDAFLKPISLAFESVEMAFIILGKKRYASRKILSGDVKPDDTNLSVLQRTKVDVKGMDNVRRDNAPIGSETQGVVLHHLLVDQDVEKAVAYVKKVIDDVLMDRLDMSMYIITKGLSKTDAQYELSSSKQQHTELKKRIAKRAKHTGEIVPVTGDRVPFVIIDGHAMEKNSEQSEDPIFVQKNGIPLNKRYYIYKQIMAATLKLFTCVWEPEKIGLIKSSMSDKVRSTLIAYRRLFADKHLTHIKQSKARDFRIGKDTQLLPTCLHPGCGDRLKTDTNVCGKHSKESAFNLLAVKRDQLYSKLKEARDICRKCADIQEYDNIACSNMTCTNFFYRDRVAVDVEDLCKDMERFDVPLTMKSPFADLPVMERKERPIKVFRPTKKKRGKEEVVSERGKSELESLEKRQRAKPVAEIFLQRKKK